MAEVLGALATVEVGGHFLKSSEVVFLILLSTVGVGFCLHGWLVGGYSWTVMMLPVFVAAALLVLCSVRILRTLRTADSDPEASLQLDYWQQLRATFGGALWCMLVLPLLALLGYPLGLSLFAAIYARTHGSSWLASIVFGCSVMTVVWILAIRLLALPLNVLPGWLG